MCPSHARTSSIAASLWTATHPEPPLGRHSVAAVVIILLLQPPHDPPAAALTAKLTPGHHPGPDNRVTQGYLVLDAGAWINSVEGDGDRTIPVTILNNVPVLRAASSLWGADTRSRAVTRQFPAFSYGGKGGERRPGEPRPLIQVSYPTTDRSKLARATTSAPAISRSVQIETSVSPKP